MTSSIHQHTEFSAQRTELADMQFFQTSTHIRASTAPSRPLTEVQQFKLSKKFTQLEQAVVCSNQLLHSSFDKFDLDSPEGQQVCQKYLQHIENLCKTYSVATADRQYRSKFSQAYKVLYKQGQLSYLTEILDSAQEGFPYLWVNGEKYSFSQEVLDYGSKLMMEFFKLEHCLRDLYGKITQQPTSIIIQSIVGQIKNNLLDFDISWSTFEKFYVMELMNIQVKARSLIAKAIEAEKDLTSVEIRQKMKGKVLLNSEDYLSIRNKLVELIAQINHITNTMGKGRDDLDHSILCQTEGIIRRVTRQQSKATRILAQKIRSSFTNIRMLLRKYDKNIQMVDPQLKNNSDLVEALVEYEKSWEKGANYFCDVQKKRYLVHFSGALQSMAEKHQKFKNMIEFLDSDIFIVVPSLLILKSLDKDDKNLCKYFLPNLNQIDTKIFRSYFDLEKQYEQWKKASSQHYNYYNILEKMIIGEQLSLEEQNKYRIKTDLVEKILAKIKILGSQLHRYNPTEWNSFMEVCMAGALSQ